MMAPTLRFLTLTVQSYMLAVLVGVWAGLWLASRAAQQLGVDGDRVYSLGFRALLATVPGARLVYVINHWAAYQDALLSALSPTPVALAWSEGALIGAVVAVVFWNRFQLPVGATLDAVAPGLTLAMALGSGWERFSTVAELVNRRRSPGEYLCGVSSATRSSCTKRRPCWLF